MLMDLQDNQSLSNLMYGRNLPNSLSFSYQNKKKIKQVIQETFLSRIENKVRKEVISDEAATDRNFGLSKLEENSGIQYDRVACAYCKRLFCVERIEKHQRICEKNFKKVEISKKVSPKPVKLAKGNRESVDFHYPQSKWQKQHNDLINKLRGDECSEDYEEYVNCIYCSRRFAPGPAEKHIEKCKNIIHKPKPPPTKVLPMLKKRNNSFVREKYYIDFSGKGSPKEEGRILGGATDRTVNDEVLQQSQITIMKKVKIKHLTEPRSKSIYKMSNPTCKCGEILPARALYCMMCGQCRYK